VSVSRTDGRTDSASSASGRRHRRVSIVDATDRAGRDPATVAMAAAAHTHSEGISKHPRTARAFHCSLFWKICIEARFYDVFSISDHPQCDVLYNFECVCSLQGGPAKVKPTYIFDGNI